MRRCRGKLCKGINPDGIWKAEENFPRNKSRGSGYQAYCKECDALYRSLRKSKNPGSSYRREDKLRQKYGLSLLDYKNMSDAQGGVCAICCKPCSSGRNLAVDHNHSTGKVRGLLCTKCNLYLGFLEENPEWITRCNIYLSRD